MGKPKVTTSTVLIPDSVLITGKRWKVQPYTKAVKTELEKMVPGAANTVGSTLVGLKRIYYAARQHEEELLDTLLHEGLHAICYERSNKQVFSALCQDEEAVEYLTAELLNYLKQVAEIKLRKKPRRG
jgi:hypothetical protein